LQEGIDGLVFEYLWPTGYAEQLVYEKRVELLQLEAMMNKMDDLTLLTPRAARLLYAY
jgi:hypothetical protein